jgi:hypothetical protein
MTKDEYNVLFHGLELNRVAFKRLMDCDEEVLSLVNHAIKAEREAIKDEWWMCVQSDLENGVKSLNEQAATKWRKEYPEIAKFGAWLNERGETK